MTESVCPLCNSKPIKSDLLSIHILYSEDQEHTIKKIAIKLEEILTNINSKIENLEHKSQEIMDGNQDEETKSYKLEDVEEQIKLLEDLIK